MQRIVAFDAMSGDPDRQDIAFGETASVLELPIDDGPIPFKLRSFAVGIMANLPTAYAADDVLIATIGRRSLT